MCFGAMLTGVSVRLCLWTAHFQRALLHFGGCFCCLFEGIFLLILWFLGCCRWKCSIFCVLGGFRWSLLFSRGVKKKGFFVYTFAAGVWANLGFLVCEHETTTSKSFWVLTAFWVKSASRTPIFVVFWLGEAFRMYSCFRCFARSH